MLIGILLWLMLSVVIGALFPVMAGDYEPIPKGWDIKVGLPGTLLVGAQFCTQSGKCQLVGDDIVGFTIGGTAVGGVQGCRAMPGAEPCLKAELPVLVLAESLAGSVIVRLMGKNYATSKDFVSVVYRGVRMLLMKYDECFSPGKHITVAPIGKPPCPVLPPDG
jgi:hypothetical protein